MKYEFNNSILAWFVNLTILAVGLTLVFKEIYLDTFTHETSGLVIEITDPQPRDRWSRHVRLQYSVDGTSFETNASNQRLKVGDKITVRYWDGAPERGFIRDGLVVPICITSFAIFMIFRRFRVVS